MRPCIKVFSFCFAMMLGILAWVLSCFVAFYRITDRVFGFLPPHFLQSLPSSFGFIYVSPAVSAIFSGFVVSIINKDRIITAGIGVALAGTYGWYYSSLNNHFFSTSKIGLIVGSIVMGVTASLGHFLGGKVLSAMKRA